MATGHHIIGWNDLDHDFAEDGLGRKFKWTQLKEKTIFLCGHGQHLFKDGYVAVPAGTFVKFYQTYGMCLNSPSVFGIIQGLRGHWLEPERMFREGQSCPNMTLFEDDERQLNPTDEALKRRIAAIPDASDNAFIFNANQFDHLEYADFGKEQKKVLKLEDIFRKLPGNTFEWVCCQQLVWNESISKTVRREKLTDPGLIAAQRVRDFIAGGYNQEYRIGERKPLDGLRHLEGAGVFHPSLGYDTPAPLERMQGLAAKRLEQARGTYGGEQARKVNLGMVKKYKETIENGLRFLENQKQQTAAEYFKKRSVLQTGLQQSEALLKVLRGPLP